MKQLPECRLCPRLYAYRQQQKAIFPNYFCQPVPAFGNAAGPLLIVGLAPGLHGANATGRPFTGDASGDILFRNLHRFGFASRPQSRFREDDTRLIDCRITNAVKCVPPQNRPNGSEIEICNRYLRDEISQLGSGAVLLALGGIAHRSIVKALGLKQSEFGFGHLAEHPLPGERLLIDSYHCSRYNLNTGRLDKTMFEQVFERIREILT